MYSAQTKLDVKWFKSNGPGIYRVLLRKEEETKTTVLRAEDRLDATLRAERAHPGWHMVMVTIGN